ncbi:MAG: hypothetical protein P1V51_01790 [Deltaproteobacteria bacterium]|nr:hypothetical protein [Deltaproteobacteria bacterium]
MPGWLRTILLAAVAGTVLGVGLGFLRSETGPAELEVLEVGALEPLDVPPRPISEKESGMPAYADAQLSAFSDQMNVQGVPMSTGWFTAPDPIEVVQQFYETRLSEAGMQLVSKRFESGIGYVGYREKMTDLQHTATLIPQGDDSTLVFVSTSSAPDVMRSMQEARVPEVLPHPPSATHTAVMGAGVEGIGQQWVTATVPDLTLGQLIEYYEAAFVERGWQRPSVTMGKDGKNAWIKARKSQLEAQVSLRHDPLSQRPGIQVFSLLSDHSKPAGAAPPAVAN